VFFQNRLENVSKQLVNKERGKFGTYVLNTNFASCLLERKKNKSRSLSVQNIDKSSGQSKIVKVVGFGHIQDQ
jgi:hypothetical protein